MHSPDGIHNATRLTSQTKLTLSVIVTLTDTVTLIFFYAHFVDIHKKVVPH